MISLRGTHLLYYCFTSNEIYLSVCATLGFGSFWTVVETNTNVMKRQWECDVSFSRLTTHKMPRFLSPCAQVQAPTTSLNAAWLRRVSKRPFLSGPRREALAQVLNATSSSPAENRWRHPARDSTRWEAPSIHALIYFFCLMASFQIAEDMKSSVLGNPGPGGHTRPMKLFNPSCWIWRNGFNSQSVIN